MSWEVLQGDVRDKLREIPENTFDACITDPPYELGFMGKKWDSTGIAYNVGMWQEVLRVLKPGGHLLSFGGSRTYHRMACAIEDTGFEIRDQIMWVYGSGFPKSQNIGKAIDKHGGQSVSWFGEWLRKWRAENGVTQKEVAKLFPSKTGGMTGCVANWELGFNLPTAEQFTKICRTFDLPFESIEEAERDVVGKSEELFGRKSGIGNAVNGHYTVGGTKAEAYDITAPATPEAIKWDGWGSALKPAHEPIVLARKPLSEKTIAGNVLKWGTGGINIDGCRVSLNGEHPPTGSGKPVKGNADIMSRALGNNGNVTPEEGRFPANLIHDGSEEVVRGFPQTVSTGGSGDKSRNYKSDGRTVSGSCQATGGFGDKGSAARFFYCAKASKAERGEGNNHPTVKPLKLMEYLIRLITLPGGKILDPFAGSGTTLLAAENLNVDSVGIELNSEYVKLIEKRMSNFQQTIFSI